jgi:ABC-type glycerol-3-phosphate transport system substrate-binding protein
MNVGNMSKFQLIVIGVFILAAMSGLLIFALGKTTSTGTFDHIVIWGTQPEPVMTTLISNQLIANQLSEKKVSVKYVQKDADTFDKTLVEALANGTGPDAFLLSQDAILQYKDKIIPIPFSSLSERTFNDTYIQEGDLFVTPQGIAAVPFSIDPMVMYWNRDSIFSAGLANPPTTWTELYSVDIPKLNKVDVNHNIIKTAVALGTFGNVSHAKDILSLLILQAGSPIIASDLNSLYTSVLGKNQGKPQNPAVAAVDFYTQFADPAKDIYSWNSSLPLSRDSFTSGDLAFYFGYASEIKNIHDRNPNLNFDVASIPQAVNNSTKITFGNMQGIAILRSAKNPKAVLNAITVLTGTQAQLLWSQATNLPPVVRSLLSKAPSDPILSVFYDAALKSHAWLDPERNTTAVIFANMVQAVVSGANTTGDAVRKADEQIKAYIDSTNLNAQ